MIFNKKLVILIIVLIYLTGLFSCAKNENPVSDYFENAELQYEGKLQEENITNALNDILNLSEEELKTKRYLDYTGNEDQWDLPTLIYKHFVPDQQSKTLGSNFYHNVKAIEVQNMITLILDHVK